MCCVLSSLRQLDKRVWCNQIRHCGQHGMVKHNKPEEMQDSHFADHLWSIHSHIPQTMVRRSMTSF